jgi:hypothetical protein
MKTIMLLMLTTSQRPQVLTKLDLKCMKRSTTSIEFALSSLDLKQGRPNFKAPVILLKQFTDNKKLCILHYMSYYLQRTALLRKTVSKVFITTTKPHRAASQNTLSRWFKLVLQLAGIDTNTFSAGSTRAASVSKACIQGAPIDLILKAGGWTRQSTFTSFYKKPILPTSVASKVLESN